MNILPSLWRSLLALALCIGLSATAQETPRSGSWVVKDFKFHTGEVLPEDNALNSPHVIRALFIASKALERIAGKPARASTAARTCPTLQSRRY